MTIDPAGRWTAQQILVVTLCFIINTIDGMDILILTYVAPALQASWGVDSGRFAIVFSAGLGGMAIGGMLVAPLADRIGRKRMIMLALLLMSAAMVLSGRATGLGLLIVARTLVGTGIGAVLACMAATAADHAPPRHRDFAVGVLQAGYPIGATLTGLVVAGALPIYGWSKVLTASGFVTLAIVPVLAILLPSGELVIRRTSRTSPVAALLHPERRRPTLLLWCATITMCMVLYFILSWITKLAIEAGLSQSDAIIASAIYNMGAVAGTVALSIGATRIAVHRLTAALLGSGIAFMLLFGAVAMPVALTLLTAFALGVTLGGGFNGLYPVAAGTYPPDLRTAGIGWAMGIGRIGAFTGPLIGGAALSLHLPLVAIFGIFCVPLATAAMCTGIIRNGSRQRSCYAS